MSVVIETTLGDLTVDLFLTERPRACLNFLKLCKLKYYNFNLFHTISKGFIAQTGDPTGSRTGGESVFGVLDGSSKRYFEAESEPRIKHTRPGLISFVGGEKTVVGSQFFITLGEDLSYLDDKHCVFGEVVEGFDILEAINEVICDNDDRPYQDVRITHTVVLEDPFPDPKGLRVPSRSPSPTAERLAGGRIAPDEEIDETSGRSAKEIAEMQAEREAKARATILEMVGDIPDADMAPPENVLFVCKLNPVTTDDDLEIIFSRFGKIKSCEVIRDRKTGDSLQYAFIEFEEQKSCEDAYFKMANVLIDDRRIHVDFSQSVSKVKWLGKGKGVAHYDEKGNKRRGDVSNDIGQGNYKLRNGIKQRSPDRGRERRSSRSPRSRSGYSIKTKSESSKKYNGRFNSPDRERKNKINRSPKRTKGRTPPENQNEKSNKDKYSSSRRNRSRSRSSMKRDTHYRSPDRYSNKSSARKSTSPRRRRIDQHSYGRSSSRRSPSPRLNRSSPDRNDRRRSSPKSVKSQSSSNEQCDMRERYRQQTNEESKRKERKDMAIRHSNEIREQNKNKPSYENSRSTTERNKSERQNVQDSDRKVGKNKKASDIAKHKKASKGNKKRSKYSDSSDESETESENEKMKRKKLRKKVESSSEQSSDDDEDDSSSEEENCRTSSNKSKSIKAKNKKSIKAKNKNSKMTKKKYSSSSSSSSSSDSEDDSTSDSSSSSSSSSSESDHAISKKKRKRTKK